MNMNIKKTFLLFLTLTGAFPVLAVNFSDLEDQAVKSAEQDKKLLQQLCTQFKQKDATCSICLETIPTTTQSALSANINYSKKYEQALSEKSDAVKCGLAMLDCGHTYHPECISQWQSGKQSAPCPLCRKNYAVNKKSRLDQLVPEFRFPSIPSKETWFDKNSTFLPLAPYSSLFCLSSVFIPLILAKKLPIKLSTIMSTIIMSNPILMIFMGLILHRYGKVMDWEFLEVLDNPPVWHPFYWSNNYRILVQDRLSSSYNYMEKKANELIKINVFLLYVLYRDLKR